MKKFILTLVIGFIALTNVHAQQTVIVQKTPGLLEGLVNAATAIATAPVVFGSAIVSGVGEVFAPAINGTTRITTVNGYGMPIVTTPPLVTPAVPSVVAPAPVVPPVVAPAPVVTTPVVPAPVVAPAAPVVVAPTIVNPEIYSYPYGPVSTITTQTVSPCGSVTVQSYVRPTYSYEYGLCPAVPVPIEHRVGPGITVNPYVFMQVL